MANIPGGGEYRNLGLLHPRSQISQLQLLFLLYFNFCRLFLLTSVRKAINILTVPDTCCQENSSLQLTSNKLTLAHEVKAAAAAEGSGHDTCGHVPPRWSPLTSATNIHTHTHAQGGLINFPP